MTKYEEFSRLLKEHYGITAEEGGYEAKDVERFDTAQEAVEYYGNKYDLIPIKV